MASITLPTALAIAGTATSVIGAGMGYMQAQQQAQAQSQAAAYSAQVSRNNAILRERQAQDAEQRGAVAEQQKRQQFLELAGKQRTVLAANGVEVNSGSALDLQSDTAAAGELDALTVRANYARDAASYRADGGNYSATAGLQESQASNASAAAGMAGVASLISGAGSVASKWYTFSSGTSLKKGGELE